MSGPAVRFEAVAKRYGDVRAVDDVSVHIAAGTFVALVGISGSGKSTLLKMVNRLVSADAGRIMIDGMDVVAGDVVRLRRRIGYVFQNVGLFPHLSVAENVAIIPRLSGGCVDVVALLEEVGLTAAHAGRLPHALSGGEQQRVGIARAIGGGARLLLMDEPFGALDPITRDALGRHCRALHDRHAMTTILVTHDMAEALLLADRVLVMAKGRLVADATPAELLAGHGGPEAAALVDVPQRQAERLRELGR